MRMPQIDTFSKDKSMFSWLRWNPKDNNHGRKSRVDSLPKTRMLHYSDSSYSHQFPANPVLLQGPWKVGFSTFYLIYVMGLIVDMPGIVYPVDHDFVSINAPPATQPRATGSWGRFVSPVSHQKWTPKSPWTNQILSLLEFRAGDRESSQPHQMAETGWQKLRSCGWSCAATGSGKQRHQLQGREDEWGVMNRKAQIRAADRLRTVWVSKGILVGIIHSFDKYLLST